MCGKSTTTNTQTSSQPPYQVMQAYNQLLYGNGGNYQGAFDVANTQYAPYTGQMVAPVNPQQYAGIGGINQFATAAQPWYMQGGNLLANAAVPLTPQQIQRYMDPYTQDVINATQAEYANTNAQQQQQLLANAASQGALGGNRTGEAQAALAGQQQIAEAPVLAGLSAQAYTTGLGTAIGQFQANPENVAGSLGALGTGYQNAMLGGANAMIGAGTLEQQTQQATDVAAQTAYWQQQGYPFQVAAWLANIAVGSGSALGGTSQSSTTQPAPFFGLSDERAKEDISKIGQTKDGQNIYRYRYKGSPEWRVGLMAQEVEQRHPEAVADIGGGYKGVDVKGATDDSAMRKGYQFGGSPMNIGGTGVPFGPLDQSLVGGGLGSSLYSQNMVRGPGPPKATTPGQKPQSAMDMFDQASKMANAGSTLGSGFQKAGNWLSSPSVQGMFTSPDAATSDMMAAAEGTDVPMALDASTIGEGVGAAAADAGATAAASSAADALPLLLLAADGGRTNYPGGLALPSRNRINLPMRAGLGMPTFVKGYQGGGSPFDTSTFETADAEAARQHALDLQAYNLSPTSDAVQTFNSDNPPGWSNVSSYTPAAAARQDLTGDTTVPAEAEARAEMLRHAPGVGGVSPQVLAYGEPPPGVAAPSGGYQAAPRTTVRPQLAGGQGEGFMGMSPDFWYSALAGVASALASPSPFAGNAIGQGLLGGLGAYSGLKKGEANIEMEAQKLDQAAKAEQDRINYENQNLQQQQELKKQQLEIQREQQRSMNQFREFQESKPQPFYDNATGQVRMMFRDPNKGWMWMDNGMPVGPNQPTPDKPSGTPGAPGVGPGVPTSQNPQPGTQVASVGNDVPSTRQLVNSGQTFNYAAGGPTVSKGMDLPEPQEISGKSPQALKQDAEYYAATGKLPPLARGNSPVAMQTNAYRTAVQNYGAALSQSRGIDPQTQAMMWREAPLYGKYVMGTDGRATVALGTAVRHLDLLQQLATEWQANPNSQTVNRIRAVISQEFGGTAATSLEAAAGIVGTEIVKAIGVSGAGTEAERKAEAAFASPIATGPQLQTAVGVVQGLLGGQLEGKMRQAKAAGLTDDQFKNLIGDRPFEILSHAGGQGKPPAITGRDQQALDWANAHPNDDRAKRIKAQLGVP